MKLLITIICALLCTAAPAWAQEQQQQRDVQAYVGARIITVSNAAIEDGVLVVRKGKIVGIGARGTTTIPAGAEVRELKGMVIMPGLVDTHSHIGGGSGGDQSAPIQPDVRLLDSFNARDTSLKRARAGGITTVNVMPGSGHLLSGQTLYLKLRDGQNVEDLLIRDAQGNIAGGIKMANGTNPLGLPPFPGTRAKSAALLREQLTKAQDYRAKILSAKGDAAKRPARDLAMEALVEVLEGKRTVHFHTHRADDIMTVLRLSREFSFRVVLHHISEGWKVAGEIAKAKAPASVIIIDSPGGKLEAMDVSFKTADILDRAGVLVGFHTDDYITDSRLFLRSAAMAVRVGMPREKALYAMTLAGARMLDLQERTGSLEPGKDADFIILNGDPLSVYTKVMETFVEGVRVFDRNNPQDRLYAVGGYGAGRDEEIHIDGEEEGGEGQQ
jgi:imidazolonepropionase-like amidohydrolase